MAPSPGSRRSNASAPAVGHRRCRGTTTSRRTSPGNGSTRSWTASAVMRRRRGRRSGPAAPAAPPRRGPPDAQAGRPLMAEYKLLTKDFGMDGIQTLAVYERSGGYEGLRKALRTMTPDELVAEVRRLAKHRQRHRKTKNDRENRLKSRHKMNGTSNHYYGPSSTPIRNKGRTSSPILNAETGGALE